MSVSLFPHKLHYSHTFSLEYKNISLRFLARMGKMIAFIGFLNDLPTHSTIYFYSLFSKPHTNSSLEVFAEWVKKCMDLHRSVKVCWGS